MTKLYELTEQFKQLESLAANDDCAYPVAVADTMEAIEGEFKDKAEALMMVVSNISTDVDALNTEIKRLQARKKIMQNRQESLRSYLRHNMEVTDINKIECPIFSITLSKARDTLVIDNIEALPDDYVEAEVVLKPKSDLILKELKAGKKITGASLGQSKRALTIR